MSTPADQPRPSSCSWWLDLALLALLSAVLYLPGLASHGVTNWQEAQRLIVARDMQHRWQAGEGIAALVVPTVNGKPYLAKPPVVYWAQLALAEPLGQRVELFHLRLSVALAGIVGVLATYLLARILFSSPTSRQSATSAPSAFGFDHGRAIGWWAAALLATGILSTRSARIGELDVFLMPFCTLAIACVAIAWRFARDRGRTCWPAVLGAAVFTTLAILTKDPAVMIVGFGGFLAMAVYLANEPRPEGGPLRYAVPAAAGLAALMFTLLHAEHAGDVVGAVLIAGGVFGAVYAVLPILNLARLRRLFAILSRTHPLIVLGVPVAIRFGWAAWVDGLVGHATAGSLAKAEVEDNVRLFVAEAPINNLEAATYGVGLGSLVALGVLIWAVRARPRLTPSGAQLASWIGFGLLAFSVLGKGVPRYLTPLWPAIAIVGGWGLFHGLAWARLRLGAPWLKTAVAIGLIGLGLAQTAWYGYGREAVSGERSPAAFAAVVRENMDVRERTRVFSFEFATPALDYYFGYRVRPLGDPRVNSTMAGGKPWTVERLHRFLSQNTRPRRSAIVLMRAEPVAGIDPTPAPERLRAAGFTLEEIELPGSARFEIDRGRTHVLAYRATVAKRLDGPEQPDDDADEQD
jgi:4-amino-4-deoxy-L-arabinose transferase-like glycosyltransferase